MKPVGQGCILLDIMVTGAILGILAAMAIPAYPDYPYRARVSEALNPDGTPARPSGAILRLSRRVSARQCRSRLACAGPVARTVRRGGAGGQRRIAGARPAGDHCRRPDLAPGGAGTSRERCIGSAARPNRPLDWAR
jgi:Tfp pilus assembly protein FimT